jgi:uncharacterized protein (DUF111 family)
MEINKIYYNTFHLGTGTIKSSHGEIPVPVPAVTELIKNHKSKITDKAGELITPTAAAILTTLGSQTKPADFTILETGTGLGKGASVCHSQEPSNRKFKCIRRHSANRVQY